MTILCIILHYKYLVGSAMGCCVVCDPSFGYIWYFYLYSVSSDAIRYFFTPPYPWWAQSLTPSI